MRNTIIALAMLFAALFSMNSCNDPTIIGSDLLSGDQINVAFTDTISLQARTVMGDSVRTYSPNPSLQLTSYLCGALDDPVFGLSTAQVFAGLSLNNGNSPNPAFSDDGVGLDSIVLILPWFANGFYGDTTEIYGLAVYRLEEQLDDTIEYFSNQSLIAFEKIGETKIIPSPNTKTTIESPGSDSIVIDTLIPELRIRMDEGFSSEFFNAVALNFESSTAFLNFFKGINVRPTTTNGGMLSFSLRSPAAVMAVYYHRDSMYYQYNFPISAQSVKFTTFEQDYTGSTIENFIDDPEKGDSLVFLQGMAGVNVRVNFPYSGALSNIAVNKAELELTILQLAEEGGINYDPVDRMIVSEVKEDGSKRLITDVTLAISRNRNNFSTIFGGTVVDGNKYLLNLTSHYQELILGSVSNEIEISVFLKGDKASRVVLAGPKLSDSPLKLRLSFTTL